MAIFVFLQVDRVGLAFSNAGSPTQEDLGNMKCILRSPIGTAPCATRASARSSASFATRDAYFVLKRSHYPFFED